MKDAAGLRGGAQRLPLRRRVRAARAAAELGVLVALGSAVGMLVAGCSISAPLVHPPAQPAPAAGGGQQLRIWLTGYSWQDNTPPGSSKVGEPVLHQLSGGTGTFADPITVATPGHQGNQEWKPGTKFYLPTVQRYVIVEDSGAAPAPPGSDTHLDMWIEGQDGTKVATDDCETQFTGAVPAQVDPPDGLAVMAGPIYANHACNISPQPDNLGTYKDPGGPQPSHAGSHSGGHSGGLSGGSKSGVRAAN